MADGLLDRLGASLRALVSLYGPRADRAAFGLLTGILPGGRGELSPRGTNEYLKAYSESPWLRAVVQKIAHVVATTEWQLYVAKAPPAAPGVTGKVYQDRAFQRDSDWRRRAYRRKELASTGDLQQLDTHPMLDLLNSTNTFLTGLMTRQLTQIYLDLVGEAFWVKERKTKTGPPIAVWPIPPTWVFATPTPIRPYFEVRYRGWQVEIPDTEVLWMADPNPLNPYGRGAGMTHALGDELDTDEYAARHTKLWFQNRARPDVLITMEGANPAEVARLEQDWLSKSQGFWRAFKPYFLSGKGNVQIKELNQTFQDMQLIELRKFERDMVMQVYGVSPEIMGVLANSNRATITAADYMFARWVVTPRLEFQRAILQERLAPEFDERLIVDYASPIQRDEDHELAVATAAPYVLTVDEWREMLHLPALPKKQGQVHMVPSTLTAVEDISSHAPPPPTMFPASPGGRLPPGQKPGLLPPGEAPPADGQAPPGQKPPKAASWSTPAGTLAAQAQWRGVAGMLQKAQGHDGFMVALWVPAASAGLLALPGAEPPDQLHCTLAFCGPYRQVPVVQLGDTLAALDALAADWAPLDGAIGGYGQFTGTAGPGVEGAQDVFYASLDVPGLVELRQAVVTVLVAHGIPPLANHGFTPHVTLAYLPQGTAAPSPSVQNLPLHFDALTLALGDTHLSVPLTGPLSGAIVPLPLPHPQLAPETRAGPYSVKEAHPTIPPAEIQAARDWWRQAVAPTAGIAAGLLDAAPVGAPPAGRRTNGYAVTRFNPVHDPHSGEFASGEGDDGGAASPRPALTGLARRMVEVDVAGDTLRDLFSSDPDAPANIADNYNLNTVTDRMREQAARQVQALSQWTLQQRGVPDPATVWRAGEVSAEIVSASLEEGGARSFARRTGMDQSRVTGYTIPRAAILVDVNGVKGSRQPYPGEAEVLVRGETLRAPPAGRRTNGHAVTRYSADQPREPAGSSAGGEWAGAAGGLPALAPAPSDASGNLLHPAYAYIAATGYADRDSDIQSIREERVRDATAADLAARVQAQLGAASPFPDAAAASAWLRPLLVDWGNSARSSSVLALHEAVRQKFDLPTEAMRGIDPVPPSPEQRALVDAIYANTQAHLAAAGITELTLARGARVRDTYLPSGFQSDADPRHGAQHVDAPALLAPLSSWTGSAQMAGQFTSFLAQAPRDASIPRTRVQLTATVPAARIFSTGRTGLGELRGTEFVLVGGQSAVRWHAFESGAGFVYRAAALASGLSPVDEDAVSADWLRVALDHPGLVARAFNPDQPRDDHGQWTSDGGVATLPTPSGSGPSPTQMASELQGHDSLAKYTRPDGTLEPARQALHDAIVARALVGVPSQAHPTAYLIGGGAAAGKSTMLNSGAVTVPARGAAVYVEPDEVKNDLPEFKAGLAKRDPNIAGYVHAESSNIGKRVLSEAIGRHTDLIHDAIHNTSLGAVEQRVARMRAAGYRVEASYATVPIQTAVDRAQARGERTGRFVPLDAIMQGHAGVAAMFPSLLSHHVFDKVTLHETSGTTPHLLASQTNGHTVIHDRAGYAAFLARKG